MRDREASRGVRAHEQNGQAPERNGRRFAHSGSACRKLRPFCSGWEPFVRLWSAAIGSNIEELALSTISERQETLKISSTHPLIRTVIGLKDNLIQLASVITRRVMVPRQSDQ